MKTDNPELLNNYVKIGAQNGASEWQFWENSLHTETFSEIARGIEEKLQISALYMRLLSVYMLLQWLWMNTVNLRKIFTFVRFFHSRIVLREGVMIAIVNCNEHYFNLNIYLFWGNDCVPQQKLFLCGNCNAKSTHFFFSHIKIQSPKRSNIVARCYLSERNDIAWEFIREGCRSFRKVIIIFPCTYPNWPRVGAIDNLDRFWQVFDPY